MKTIDELILKLTELKDKTAQYKLVYEWVKTGVITFPEFLKLIDHLEFLHVWKDLAEKK